MSKAIDVLADAIKREHPGRFSDYAADEAAKHMLAVNRGSECYWTAVDSVREVYDSRDLDWSEDDDAVSRLAEAVVVAAEAEGGES